MLNYVHDVPTKLYFGQGSISNLKDSLAKYGRNVLLVYGGGSIKKIGLYDEIYKILGNDFNIVECDGVEPNPRIESVEKGVNLCKENNVDVVLAVGGGSTIDCSKAICTGYYYDGDLWEMIKTREKGRKSLPLVVVLTLSATGSEFDGGGVITNLKTKEKLGSVLTYPSVSICDPTYTYSVSKYQTAAGSADIMSHIMEGYFSRTMDADLSDGIAETVLKSVMNNLPVALKDPTNYSARANLMACANVACSGIPEYGKQYSGWVAHAIEHELSAYYDITHGVGLAILTPRILRYMLKKDPSVLARYVRFSNNVMNIYGDDDLDVAYKGIDALEDFFKKSGLPMTLSELNIDETYFEKMAVHANINDRLAKAYVPLDKNDVIEILEACL